MWVKPNSAYELQLRAPNTSTTVQEISNEEPSLNLQYSWSPLGLMKIAQLLLSIIVMACVSRGLCYFTCWYTNYGDIGASGQYFVLAVVTLCTVGTFFFFLLNFAQCLMSLCGLNVPWLIIELIYTTFAVIAYLISFCMEAAYASGDYLFNLNDHAAWIAAAIFCFCILCQHVATFVLLCRELGLPASMFSQNSPLPAVILPPVLRNEPHNLTSSGRYSPNSSSSGSSRTSPSASPLPPANSVLLRDSGAILYAVRSQPPPPYNHVYLPAAPPPFYSTGSSTTTDRVQTRTRHHHTVV